MLVSLWTACAQPRGADEPSRSTAAASPRPDLNAPWLSLDAPQAGSSVVSLAPLVELRGRVGVGLQGPQDLVLAVDTSGSVFWPSGIDFDGDGSVGVPACDFAQYHRITCPSYRRWTTDFDDIVLKVEIAAALELVALLDPRTARMGMVKFGDSVWVEQEVGSLDGVQASLSSFRYVMRGGTDIIAGLERSIDVLEDAPANAAGMAQRTVLLLSDGMMSLRGDRSEAEVEAYVTAFIARARASGTRVFAFGVGVQDDRGTALLEYLASETQGRYVAVPVAREIAVELPLVSLTGVSDVEIVNTTNGKPARATRIFPDGTFDALVPLRDGENALRVVATLEDGRRLEAHTQVSFARPDPPGAQDLEARDALLSTLRRRTVTTDAAARVHAERRRRRLQRLEIEVDDPNAPLQ
ncbi:MAG: vWA domain-containing protein [Myxococcota bacterium]